MRRRGASHESALTGRRLLAGGVTALTVTFAFVAANAIWYQPHAHKAPILSTRTAHLPVAPQTRPANETAVADTRTESDDEEVTTIIRLEREPSTPPQGDPLVADIQKVMAELGLYEGDIDGLAGPMTRRAIETYQEKIGIEVTGRIDETLVAKLGLADEPTVPVPPAPRPSRAEPPQPQTDSVQTASLGDDGTDALVLRIQAGLRAFGNDDIQLDGISGPRTRAAIREFQSLFGLPETGEPDRETYAKMREIGLTD